MNIPDLINGSFEALASIFLLNHCRTLYKDKLVRGVSLISTLFFFSWGIWNLFYYKGLEQYFSWYAGMAVVTVNGLWVAMMFYYRRAEHRDAPKQTSSISIDNALPSFMIFCREHIKNPQHMRLGQKFCNLYIRGPWPELFYANDDKACTLIQEWLVANQYTDTLPTVIVYDVPKL